MFSANQGTLVGICKLMHFDGAQKLRWVLYVAYGLLIPCATLIECALVRILFACKISKYSNRTITAQ